MQVKRSKTAAFTLFEIMICLMILALVGGVVGVQMKQSLDRVRFQNQAQMVKEEIEKLQILALTFGSEMQLEIKKKNGKFVAVTKTDEAVLKKINGTQLILEGFSKISWNGTEQVKQLDILSNGRILPAGVLGMHDADEAYYLDFRLPLQIKFGQKYDKHFKELRQPEKPKDSHETAKPSI